MLTKPTRTCEPVLAVFAALLLTITFGLRPQFRGPQHRSDEQARRGR